MNKALMLLSVITLTLLLFIVNENYMQRNDYELSLDAMKVHYEKTKYKYPLEEYLTNHYSSRVDFTIKDKVSGDIIKFKSQDCFERGVKEGLIVATEKDGFCISNLNLECRKNAMTTFDGLRLNQNCQNMLFAKCSCWYNTN